MENLFAMPRFRYIEVLFHIFYYYWGKENRSSYRGHRSIEFVISRFHCTGSRRTSSAAGRSCYFRHYTNFSELLFVSYFIFLPTYTYVNIFYNLIASHTGFSELFQEFLTFYSQTKSSVPPKILLMN